MSDREAFYNVYKKVTGFTGTLEELFQDDMCATAKGRSIEVAYQCYQAALSDRKDASRYQYLRSQKENLAACFEESEFGLWDVMDGLSNEELDEAIDAAIAKRS